LQSEFVWERNIGGYDGRAFKRAKRPFVRKLLVNASSIMNAIDCGTVLTDSA
jgi:hypothetical protein